MISKLIFAGYTGSKNQVGTKQKIKFVLKSIFFWVCNNLPNWLFKKSSTDRHSVSSVHAPAFFQLILQVHYKIVIKNSWESNCNENENICLQKVCKPIAMCKKCILNCEVVLTIHWFSPSPWHIMDCAWSTRLHE